MLAVTPAKASERNDTIFITDTIGTRIFFHQSKVNLLPHYQRNKEHLDSFINELHRVQEDPRLKFRKINIVGGASPKGTKRFNKWLSEQRAARITEQLMSNTLVPLNRDMISWETPGVDWMGLKLFVLADPDVPNRDEVLKIIDNPGPYDDRVDRLKKLNYAIPWAYMYTKYFPPLRGSQVQIIYDRALLFPMPEPFAQFTYAQQYSTPEIEFEHPRLPDIPFYMAIKTNLLYDAFLIPNVGVDVYMGRNWSAVVNWEYAWWKSDPIHWYWRCYGGDAELRWWFGSKAKEKPLTGHHVGPYFQLVTYDFELGHRGYQARRWTKAAGISYGYSLPIKPRLNLDFEVGIGYAWGHFYEYDPIDDHYVWQATTRRRYIGPTKLEVSLVWLVGHGNRNKGKERKIGILGL